MKKVIVATRRSLLAQAQADCVIDRLKRETGIGGEKLLIETLGDKRLDVTIDKIGGKGVFVKDIEEALVSGAAHCAVHSMKDVPFEMHEQFVIAAIAEREDERDAFIGHSAFKHLRKGAKVGTSSLRRKAQINAVRPDIEVVPVRGNIQTRIGKIDSEKLDGVVLAAAGLKRMNLHHLITEYFSPYDFIPAIGQGAIGVEVVKNTEQEKIFSSIDISEERIRMEAERSYMRELNGGCHIPIGAYSKIEKDELYMIGMFEMEGRLIKREIKGNIEDHIELGKKLAADILKEAR